MFIHYVYRNQRRPEGLCPSSNMEQVSSTGKPIQITVTDGYDLVKLFLEIPSFFILLESTLAFEPRSLCQTSACWSGEDVLGASVGGMEFCIILCQTWLYMAMALSSQCSLLIV